MDKKQLTGILEEIGIMLELKGENPFKSRAYFNAVRQLETETRDIKDLVTTGEIGSIKGIGAALAEKISTLVTMGQLPYYTELKASIPDGLFDMLKIPGLGAKKVKAIYDQLKIATVGELEYACRENRLRDLSGFGQKSQDAILKNIEQQKKYHEYFLYPVAEHDAEQILVYLKKHGNIIRIEIAGSLRRHKEIIRDIDVVASCAEEKREAIMDYFTQYEDKLNVVVHGPTKSTLKLNSGINADLRLVNDREFPFALHHSTGSKEHNTAMRALARKQDIKMNEYGLFSGDILIECKDEEEIFARLGLSYLAPEQRENMGEIEAAANDELPDLYYGDPFYGVFHVHTTYSDGAHSLEQIVAACHEAGWQYVGISDHSKTAFYANGLTEERVREQHHEIDALNKKYTDFRIFKGIESDILPDGSLDYSDEFLRNFDFVIASVHSNFKQTESEMTQRVCRALRHPAVTMLGHPTGRLLLGREGYQINMQEVITTAGRYNKIIEINSSPYRLDLDWRSGPLARKMEIKTALNPDAHSIEGLADWRYGLGIARKAGFSHDNIINSCSMEQIDSLFQQMKK